MNLHIGSAWAGTAAEQRCPCPQTECGLADARQLDPECAVHSGADATYRQMHAATSCPGSAGEQVVHSQVRPLAAAMELHAVVRLDHPDAANREAIRRYQQVASDQAQIVAPIELNPTQQLLEEARQVLFAVASGSFAPTLRSAAGRIVRQITALHSPTAGSSTVQAELPSTPVGKAVSKL